MTQNAESAPIAHHFPASEKVVSLVLDKPVTDDGRSNFCWIRLANGDLILGVYPQGETYFEVEQFVADDFAQAEADGTVIHTKIVNGI